MLELVLYERTCTNIFICTAMLAGNLKSLDPQEPFTFNFKAWTKENTQAVNEAADREHREGPELREGLVPWGGGGEDFESLSHRIHFSNLTILVIFLKVFHTS